MYQQIWGNTQKIINQINGISSWMVGHRDYGKGAGPNHIHLYHLEIYATSPSHWIPVWQWRKRECHTFMAHITPRLGQVLKGIQATHALTHSPKERHPIIFQIMEQIQSLLSNQADNYYNSMIWAACSTAYFGLLKVSKFTASSPKHSTSFTDLFLLDIAIDGHVAPQVANQNHFETVKDRLIQTGYTHLLR